MRNWLCRYFWCCVIVGLAFIVMSAVDDENYSNRCFPSCWYFSVIICDYHEMRCYYFELTSWVFWIDYKRRRHEGVDCALVLWLMDLILIEEKSNKWQKRNERWDQRRQGKDTQMYTIPDKISKCLSLRKVNKTF